MTRARRDALEEAAKVCGAKAANALQLSANCDADPDLHDGDEFARFYRNAAACFNECEQAIRALADQPAAEAASADQQAAPSAVEDVERHCGNAALAPDGQIVVDKVLALRHAAELDRLRAEREGEYICKCGIRVTPHRCQVTEEF